MGGCVNSNERLVLGTHRASHVECSELQGVQRGVDAGERLKEEDAEARGGEIKDDGVSNVASRDERLDALEHLCELVARRSETLRCRGGTTLLGGTLLDDDLLVVFRGARGGAVRLFALLRGRGQRGVQHREHVAAEVVANEAGDELQMLIGKGVRQ